MINIYSSARKVILFDVNLQDGIYENSKKISQFLATESKTISRSNFQHFLQCESESQK